ncbi:MAG: DUF4179 domain-containing protein [Clostridium sp.]|nr:DUF4179 domain-containing protein [Clostridium sp.]
MSMTTREQLLDLMGDVDECYIREYIDAQPKTHRSGHTKMRLSFVLAAAMVMLFGMVSFAAVAPAIGHFLQNLMTENRSVIQNFSDIEAKYAVPIKDTQECDGVCATLNSAVVEDHYLLLSYTFDYSGLEEAQNGSFHTYFLPWFFYITEGETVICQSEYTDGLHTQPYLADEDEDAMTLTNIYCIDLGKINGGELLGRELTVRLLYAEDGDGFVSTFTPETCFTGKSFQLNKTYEWGEHKIRLNAIQESALYVTMFIDCDTIGHDGDEYEFVLSDELGNDYTVYPYEDHDAVGYWFTKPVTMGTQLTLKVIRSGLEADSYGYITDDSYEVLYEIPITLKNASR